MDKTHCKKFGTGKAGEGERMLGHRLTWQPDKRIKRQWTDRHVEMPRARTGVRTFLGR